MSDERMSTPHNSGGGSTTDNNILRTFKDYFKEPDLANNPFKDGMYLIDELIPKDSIGMVYGESGLGKSFSTVDFTGCIASGTPFFGHEAQRGKVLYCAGEGEASYGKRLKGWCQSHGVDEQLIKDNVKFLDVSMTSSLQFEEGNPMFQEIMAVIVDEGISPDLIVIDTFSNFFGGKDENASVPVSGFTRACRTLSKRTGATVLFVHHCGKGDTGDYRGSSAFKGNIEFSMLLAKDKKYTKEDKYLVLEVKKMKDDEELQNLIGMKLVKVQIEGMDLDYKGRVPTTCVLIPAEVSMEQYMENRVSASDNKKFQIMTDYCRWMKWGISGFGDSAFIEEKYLREYLEQVEHWKPKRIRDAMNPLRTSDLIGKLISTGQMIPHPLGDKAGWRVEFDTPLYNRLSEARKYDQEKENPQQVQDVQDVQF